MFGESWPFARRIKYASVSRKGKKIRKGGGEETEGERERERERRVVIRWGKVRGIGFINDITR